MSMFQPGDRVAYDGSIWTVAEPIPSRRTLVNLREDAFGREVLIRDVEITQVRHLDGEINYQLSSLSALCHELLGDEGPKSSKALSLRVELGKILKAALEERAE